MNNYRKDREEKAIMRLYEFIINYDISCAEDVYQRNSVNEECVTELVGILKGE